MNNEEREYRRDLIAGKRLKKLSVVAPTPEHALQFFGFSGAELWRLTEVAQTKTGILYDVDGRRLSESEQPRTQDYIPF